jgi:hypothetical protein
MPRQLHLPILFAIACALFLRALVPAGWMPSAGGNAFAIEPCPAAEPVMQMAGHHAGSTKHVPSHKPDHGGDCAFSPIHAGFASSDMPVPLRPPLQLADLPVSIATIPAFATGPPAPPPPATGPPALA